MTRRHLPVWRNDATPVATAPNTSEPASWFDGIGAVRRAPPKAKKSKGHRSATVSIVRLSKRELARGRALYPESEYDRPKTRGDCLHGALAIRPCPFVSCSQHLYLDVNEDNGNIQLNFPEREVWQVPHTCALDLADRGGITHRELGEILGLTTEYAHTLEKRIARGLRRLVDIGQFEDWSNLDRNAGSEQRKKVSRKRQPDGDASEVPCGIRSEVSPSSVLDDDHGSWCR